jgi:hypothetical protein
MDVLDSFKANQREGWAHFAPLASITTAPAARLVRHAGCMFALMSGYLPPPPPGVAPPTLWGDPNVVRERLGASVRDILFDRETMAVPSLSPQHHREVTERTSGPVMKLVETLGAASPERLEAFRQEYEAAATEYFADNTMRQGYLMTRATKI